MRLGRDDHLGLIHELVARGIGEQLHVRDEGAEEHAHDLAAQEHKVVLHEEEDERGECGQDDEVTLEQSFLHQDPANRQVAVGHELDDSVVVGGDRVRAVPEEGGSHQAQPDGHPADGEGSFVGLDDALGALDAHFHGLLRGGGLASEDIVE